jgi:hypothetical protein
MTLKKGLIMFLLDEAIVRRKYTLRCEYAKDTIIIRTILSRWILVWIEKPYIDATYPDVQVTFGVRDDAPETYVLRQILNAVIDLHVAAESLEESHAYTGVRREVLETITEKDLILEIIKEAKDALADASARMADTIETFQEEIQNA